MNDDDQNQDREFLHLVTNRRVAEPEPYEEPEEEIAQGDAYATVKGQRNAPYLEYRRKDGTCHALRLSPDRLGASARFHPGRVPRLLHRGSYLQGPR